MKKVSVVIPVYNMGNRVEACVESILKQTYENIEIVLVDDGSKDNSLEVCNNLAKKDERIKVYHTENRGSGPARNHGMENAEGDYVCFPDADDIYSPTAIEDMINAMQEQNSDFVIAGYDAIAPDGKTHTPKIYPDKSFDGDYVRNNYHEFMSSHMEFGINGAPWNKLYDMEIIRKHNVQYPPLRRHQDTGFIYRYICHINKITFISPVVYTYYQNDLKREWYKYPVDYIDAVVGLYKVANETIIEWNKNNTELYEMLNASHITKVIKSMELTFSPKVKYSSKERLERINEILNVSGIKDIEPPKTLRKYHRKVFELLSAGKIKTTVMVMRLKIFTEKNGVLNKIK